MMLKILLEEMYRAFFNKGMVAALVIGSVLTCSAIVLTVLPDIHFLVDRDGTFPPSLYNRWIGGWGIDLWAQTFFFVFPILAAMPFGWSFKTDRESGYSNQILTRTTPARYYFSKMLSVAAAGGVAVVVPMLINLLLVAFLVPAIYPNPSAIGMLTVSHTDLMGDLYFGCTELYVVIYLIIVFVTAGFVACFASFFTILVENKAIIVLGPFITLAFLNQITWQTPYMGLSPMRFIRPDQAYGSSLELMGIFFVVTAVILTTCTFFSIKRLKK